MNTYGDRGNVLCLLRRCLWRGIEAELVPIGPGEKTEPRSCDLLFFGGGQDKEQALVSEDLQGPRGDAIRWAIAEEGIPVLSVCGGYQLLGRYYRPAVGADLPGLGVLDVWTVHPGPKVPRCIGNIVVEWEDGLLVGFENHGGRTYLGEAARPLGRVIAGKGNNGEDGTEGAQQGNVFGSYLHGSFLPKHPFFADHLLRLALERKYGRGDLDQLDDSLEQRAHATALRRAGG
jgi:CobQ-like glutamine amidotransferase family enzyme